MQTETVPNCPKCGKPLLCIIEDIRGVTYTWELGEDGKYHKVDSNHYGETSAHCKNCDAELLGMLWKFWLEHLAP